MPVVFYDYAIANIVRSNLNIVGAINCALTNNQFDGTNWINSNITIATNTSAVRMNNPALALVSGNVQWSGDMVTFTATGAAQAVNMVWYSDTDPRYLIAHYQLANTNTLALNDTYSVFCNQGIANIYDPNN